MSSLYARKESKPQLKRCRRCRCASSESGSSQPCLKQFLNFSSCHSLLLAYPESPPGSWGSVDKLTTFFLCLFHWPYAIGSQVGIPTLAPHRRGKRAPHVRERVPTRPLPWQLHFFPWLFYWWRFCALSDLRTKDLGCGGGAVY